MGQRDNLPCLRVGSGAGTNDPQGLLLAGGIEASSRSNNEELRKMVLGSRPPRCVNKCMSCRPCEATLVIPPHLHNKIKTIANYHIPSSHRDQDDSYYLLSWKCRCGNKLYQP
ncbi:hypothetical protein BUALT_Bualt07G0130900 [Buddleja alternifolia]|uniref:Epidermal patterning factor-like protein n=1 Tax=Buddleja alternifolia TaxID=168488 RepID=A0AAV6XHE0_9LAMI|nr:hypothetical protein BUALT_Bualt07G0130900 [Buddleja alternifolia]